MEHRKGRDRSEEIEGRQTPFSPRLIHRLYFLFQNAKNDVSVFLAANGYLPV